MQISSIQRRNGEWEPPLTSTANHSAEMVRQMQSPPHLKRDKSTVSVETLCPESPLESETDHQSFESCPETVTVISESPLETVTVTPKFWLSGLWSWNWNRQVSPVEDLTTTGLLTTTGERKYHLPNLFPETLALVYFISLYVSLLPLPIAYSVIRCVINIYLIICFTQDIRFLPYYREHSAFINHLYVLFFALYFPTLPSSQIFVPFSSC